MVKDTGERKRRFEQRTRYDAARQILHLVEDKEDESKETLKTRKSGGFNPCERKRTTQATTRRRTESKGKTESRGESQHDAVEEVHQDKIIAGENRLDNVTRDLYKRGTGNEQKNKTGHEVVEISAGNDRERDNNSKKAEIDERTR